jgi:hypothetical protein
MIPISQEALDLVTNDAPAFVRQVDRMARRTTRRLIHLPFSEFKDNPFLAYVCIWYAQSRGVDVQFATRLFGKPYSLR